MSYAFGLVSRSKLMSVWRLKGEKERGGMDNHHLLTHSSFLLSLVHSQARIGIWLQCTAQTWIKGLLDGDPTYVLASSVQIYLSIHIHCCDTKPTEIPNPQICIIHYTRITLVVDSVEIRENNIPRYALCSVPYYAPGKEMRGEFSSVPGLKIEPL